MIRIHPYNDKNNSEMWINPSRIIHIQSTNNSLNKIVEIRTDTDVYYVNDTIEEILEQIGGK